MVSQRESERAIPQPSSGATENRLCVAKTTLALLATVLLLGAAGAWANELPPTDLKKVGDHWTAWDPPEVLPEGADVHIIESGDTLWDLAERFLGNPYLWPQIWERNSYILDAHWIYPGDPLVLGIEVESQESLEMTAADRPGSGETDEESFRFGDAYGRIEQLGGGDDIACSGYIGELEETFPVRIANSEYDFLSPNLRGFQKQVKGQYGIVDSLQYNLAVGDVVYLDQGRSAGLAAGDLYAAVSAGQIIRHPVTDDVVGRLYDYLGRVRILSVQEEGAIAEIAYSCEPIQAGTWLMPFVREPVPTERRSPLRPINYPAPMEQLADAPRILHAEDGVISIGQDHVIYVEASGDVIPGDIFTVYRVTPETPLPVVIGEIGILSVHSNSAVARVLESRYPIYVGDPLELK